MSPDTELWRFLSRRIEEHRTIHVERLVKGLAGTPEKYFTATGFLKALETIEEDALEYARMVNSTSRPDGEPDPEPEIY